MVKFIGYWMFASELWHDAGATPVTINLREVQKIEENAIPQFGKTVMVYLKNNPRPIPIEGNIIEILAEFQKHLQTMY